MHARAMRTLAPARVMASPKALMRWWANCDLPDIGVAILLEMMVMVRLLQWA